MTPRGGLTSPRLAGAVALAVALAVLVGTLLVADQRERARLRADATVRAAVASAVASVGTDIHAQITDATDGGPYPGGDLRPASRVERLPGLLPLAMRARDAGVPVLADLAQPPSVVVPVYAGNVEPRTTEQRRNALIGYRLVPLSLGSVLAPLAPANGGLSVRGPTRTVATTAGEAPPSAPSFATTLELPEAPGWVVSAWVPAPGTPAVAWVWLLGLFGLLGGLGALGVAERRRWSATEARRRRLDRQRCLVSELAPLVQASLDLGEVAPAISSHLAHSLSLAGVSVSIPSESGERPLFSWGTPPDATAPRPRELPERLERGATFAVSLTRGGRTLGLLRVVAGEPLVRTDLEALATATELLGSTLAHAETFARQQQLVERLRSIDELKTVFLATASHELRTPVTAIAGFSALLLEGWDGMEPAQGRLLLERVAANACELQALTEQLLDFSRLERGVQPMTEELLDLGATVREILASRSELVAEHPLVFDLAESCMIHGSSPAIERILTNLVGNAAKYSPPGTHIFVTVRQDDGRVDLVVDDEGSGVAPEEREHVFSRFYRGNDSGVTRTRGAGVGLAIVAEYATAMNGAAAVGDAPSGGARFVVSFPAAGSSGPAVLPGPRSEISRNGVPRVPIS